MAILNLGKDGNVVEAIIEAIASGYRDDLVLEELAQAIEDEKITKDQFTAAIDPLNLYKARFTESIDAVINAMSQFEFNDRQSIIKNRPMNLAQQVLKDVEGFNSAAKDYYSDEDDAGKESVEVKETEGKEADIKKPAPEKRIPQPPVDKQLQVDKKPEKLEKKLEKKVEASAT